MILCDGIRQATGLASFTRIEKKKRKEKKKKDMAAIYFPCMHLVKHHSLHWCFSKEGVTSQTVVMTHAHFVPFRVEQGGQTDRETTRAPGGQERGSGNTDVSRQE